MVKHLIIWDFKEGLSDSQNQSNAQKIKAGLEGLRGQIDGLLAVRVVIDMLPSSSGSMLLDCTFDCEESLKAYQTHPKHVAVATFVRTVTQNRKCVDYQV